MRRWRTAASESEGVYIRRAARTTQWHSHCAATLSKSLPPPLRRSLLSDAQQRHSVLLAPPSTVRSSRVTSVCVGAQFGLATAATATMPATPAQHRAQGADSEHGQPRLKHKGKPVVFSQEALKSAADTTLSQPPELCALELRSVAHSLTHSLTRAAVDCVSAAREFVTGFRKRRQERRAEGAAQLARKERRQRLQDRKEVSPHPPLDSRVDSSASAASPLRCRLAWPHSAHLSPTVRVCCVACPRAQRRDALNAEIAQKLRKRQREGRTEPPRIV